MAARASVEGSNRPQLGDNLVVIHDFLARSSDELSLSKGDRVELIERDDEFGDGWFLGRHLVNGNTGLFPEVYTRPTPKTASVPAIPPQPLAPLPEARADPGSAPIPEFPAGQSSPPSTADQASTQPSPKSAQDPVTLPLNSSKTESKAPPPVLSNGVNAAAMSRLNNASQDSQVLNDTLNVINEHITDLRSPTSHGAMRTAANDSGSEYSAPLDSRMSYIQGEETDEEEEDGHTRAEVESWGADAVAEYLFTTGVEKHHCEVFRDQEISGEVLLGMDQSSLFIKAFDLGSVGRRLKTWHKIKALQDEVTSQELSTRRTTQTYGSDIGSEDARRSRSRNNTLTNSISNPSPPSQSKRLSAIQSSKSPNPMYPPPTPTLNYPESPSRSNHIKRPSAASIRDLHHSRRHSSTDYHMGNVTTPRMSIQRLHAGSEGASVHKKQPSFDRNWTLGDASTPQIRPLSSTGFQDIVAASEPELQDSAVDLDRGYFSGTEADPRKRNVLRKRDSIAAAAHSHRSSYAEEQRVRSATALSRHSRFGSYDSYHEGGPSPAAQKYYGLQPGAAHKRTASTNTTESLRPVPPAKDGPISPAVTKLDDRPRPPAKSSPFSPDWLPFGKAGSKGVLGLRTASENYGPERTKARAPVEPPPKDNSIDSSGRTGSSTPSAGHSLDMDSPEINKNLSALAAPLKARGKKGKKETSAYTRGLLKISPREAMKDADYSGWMRKKSSNLMTTWKPRFFVLKGRRLAYYYSEDDDAEKGLIDISFHRVLPADNEKLMGLHATITGAVGPNNMPSSKDESSGLEKGDDSMFIFKLMPPRAGLSRAVNFTKPTVHYFAVSNLKQGRLWMAAMMKATIDRDDAEPIKTSYQQKTISLAKAKQMRHRPPALMNLEEAAEDEQTADDSSKDNNSNNNNGTPTSTGNFTVAVAGQGEADSGVSGMDKLAGHVVESSNLNLDFERDTASSSAPPAQSA